MVVIGQIMLELNPIKAADIAARIGIDKEMLFGIGDGVNGKALPAG
jgi:hypothetical protein